MNQSNANSPASRNRTASRTSKIGGVALIVLVGLYTLLQPTLNERFGLELPTLASLSGGDTHAAADASERPQTSKRGETPGESHQASPADQSNSQTDLRNNQPAPPPESPADVPGQSLQRETSSRGPPRSANENASPNQPSPSTRRETSDPASDLLYGLLRETSPKRYLSPAGLRYNPGSREGHRLEHLRRHTKDDPTRPIHGVFDGDMEGALQTIDKAYQRAKKGQRTTKKVDGDRTVYTVDMGARIGYVGGRDGARRRHPMARRVRIVLEGTQVITAFPQ